MANSVLKALCGVLPLLVGTVAHADYLYTQTQSHPEIEDLRSALYVSRARTDEARLSWFPTIEGTGEANRKAERFLGERDFDTDTEMTLNLKAEGKIFERFDYKERTNQATTQETVDSYSIQIGRLVLWGRSATLYHDYYYSQQHLKVLRESLRELKGLLALERTYVASGKATELSVSAIQVKINDTISQIEIQKLLANRSLQSLLSLIPTVSKHKLKLVRNPKGSTSWLQDTALKENPEILRDSHAVLLSQYGIREAESKHWPTLSVFLEASHRRSIYDSEGSATNVVNDVTIGLRAKIPLPGDPTLTAAEETAYKLQLQAETKKSLTVFNIRRGILEAKQAIRQHQENIAQHRNTINKYSSRKRLLREGLTEGTVTTFEVVSAFIELTGLERQIVEERKKITARGLEIWILIGRTPDV